MDFPSSACTPSTGSRSTTASSSASSSASSGSEESRVSTYSMPLEQKLGERRSSEEYYDPQLDRPLALAIAQLYTPSTAIMTPVRVICTHSLVARVRAPDTRCQHCRKAHWFGWVYRCGSCGYKVCHNCRPRFVERSWDSIWGMLRGLR